MVACLLLAACSSSSAPSSTTTACGQVDIMIDAMIAQKKGSDGALDPMRADRMERLRKAMATRCAEDHWPAPMIECLKTVTSQKNVMTCQSTHLPTDQQQKLQADIMAAMMGTKPAVR